MTGTVKKISDRGFGFVTPDDGGQDIFFHVRDTDRTLRFEGMEGMRVEFGTVATDRGLKAINVRQM